MKLRYLMFAFVFSLMLAGTPVYAQSDDGSSRRTGEIGEQELSAEEMQIRMDMIRAIRENIGLFGEVYRQVNLRYVDQISPEEFMKAGIEGMLSTLDPYTEFIEAEGTDDLRIMSQGEYGGVGLQIGTRGSERILTVISPIEGTPAWRLGIRSGDQIIEIDGEDTRGFTSNDAAQHLRGDPGTQVNVKIHRVGVDKPMEFTIVRETIEVRDVSYAGMIEPGIGYIRLTRFSRQAGDEVRQAVEDLKQQDLQSLIFDLRSNPGGLLPEAITVAENFLQPGDPIVSTRGRTENMTADYTSQGEPSLPQDIPLVILINEGSASASEIVAGAIQDLDRGVVIGRTSFGKGLVQTVLNFKDGTALRITTAKYYTPSGRLIQKVDYFSENEAILQHTDADDVDSLYHTSGGREVAAHGGIQPDFDIEMPEVGELTIALWREGKFFDFANTYLGYHPNVLDWDIGDDVYQSFQTWLDTTGFEFETEMERQLTKLREQAEDSEMGDTFLGEVGDLEAMADQSKAAMFEVEREEITLRLKMEFASVLAGSAGRTQASIEYDPQILKALELLRTQELYTAFLQGTEPIEQDQ